MHPFACACGEARNSVEVFKSAGVISRTTADSCRGLPVFAPNLVWRAPKLEARHVGERSWIANSSP